jgi:hypothetical protein
MVEYAIQLLVTVHVQQDMRAKHAKPVIFLINSCIFNIMISNFSNIVQGCALTGATKCLNGGVCSNPTVTGTACTCLTGFAGNLCEKGKSFFLYYLQHIILFF